MKARQRRRWCSTETTAQHACFARASSPPPPPSLCPPIRANGVFILLSRLALSRGGHFWRQELGAWGSEQDASPTGDKTVENRPPGEWKTAAVAWRAAANLAVREELVARDCLAHGEVRSKLNVRKSVTDRSAPTTKSLPLQIVLRGPRFFRSIPSEPRLLRLENANTFGHDDVRPALSLFWVFFTCGECVFAN